MEEAVAIARLRHASGALCRTQTTSIPLLVPMRPASLDTCCKSFRFTYYTFAACHLQLQAK